MRRKRIITTINNTLQGCDLLTLIAIKKAADQLTRHKPPPGLKEEITALLEFVDDERLLKVIWWMLIKR